VLSGLEPVFPAASFATCVPIKLQNNIGKYVSIREENGEPYANSRNMNVPTNSARKATSSLRTAFGSTPASCALGR